MKYQVRHTTFYKYSGTVNQCYNLAYLLPRATHGQKVLRSELRIKPQAINIDNRQDYFGNIVSNFSIESPHTELEVTVESLIEKEDVNNMRLEIGISCAEVLTRLAQASNNEDIAASEFLYESPMIPHSPELADFGRDLFEPGKPLMAAVRELSERIYKEFQYDPSFTTVATPLTELMAAKRGVCQDFAHLAIGCLRSLGYPARYVSGYLETLPPPGETKLEGADASHAWFAAYAPGEGWQDFDPTNNAIPAEQHLTTAWGRDYSDVTPLRGVVFGGGNQSTMDVSVDVKRL
ncbi:MAG: transglutaminase family protein [Spongiibacteraceae bacterium]